MGIAWYYISWRGVHLGEMRSDVRCLETLSREVLAADMPIAQSYPLFPEGEAQR